MAAAVTPLSQIKAFLDRRGVKYADCVERQDLVARYTLVKRRLDDRRIVRLRSAGNKAFARQSYALAVRLYTDALNVGGAGASTQAQLLGNRSAAYLALGLARDALDDAHAAVSLDSSFVKGHHRLGAAQLQLGLVDAAVETFRAALSRLDASRGSGAQLGDAEGVDERQRAEWRTSLASKLDEARARRPHALPPAGSDEAAGGDDSTGGGRAASQGDPDADAGGCELLAKLTDDLVHEVLCWLPVQPLGTAASCCRIFARIASAQLMWRVRCAADYSGAAARLGGPEEGGARDAPAAHGGAAFARDWRVLYRERFEHARRWARGEATQTLLGGVDGHQGPVYGVCLSEDGCVCASSSEDGTVQLRDMCTHEVLYTLSSHGVGVLALWLEPRECRRVVSGGFDSILKVWAVPPLDGSAESSADSPRVLLNMLGHMGPIVSTLGYDNGLLSTSFDGSMRQWDWSGRSVHSFEAHTGHVCGLTRSARSGLVFTGGDDGRVLQWDLRIAGKAHQPVAAGPGSGVESPVWSLDVRDNMLVSGATDGSLNIWDLRAFERGPYATMVDAHDDAIAGVQITADTIVTSSFDSSVKLWSSPEARPVGDEPDALANNLRAVLPAPIMSRCTRVACHDTRIVVGCIGRPLLVMDVL